jgi:hypothetical protein
MPQIKTIVDAARRNDYLVPDLQRDFKWGRERVRSLLASVIAGHPIGSIVVVERILDLPASQSHALTRGGSIGNQTAYVLDGQQRLISLLAGFRGPRERKGRDSEWYNENVNAHYWCLDLGRWLNQLKQTPVESRDAQDVTLIERAVVSIARKRRGMIRKDSNGNPITLKALSKSLMKRAERHKGFVLPLWYLLRQGGDHRGEAARVAEFMEYARTSLGDDGRCPAFRLISDQLGKILGYEISVIEVKPCSAVRAAQMFARMNMKGQPLDGADLVCSQLFIHDGRLRQDMRDFRDACNGSGGHQRERFVAISDLYEEDVLRMSACAGAELSGSALRAGSMDADRLLHAVRSREGVGAIRNGFSLVRDSHQAGAKILLACGVSSRHHWPIPSICQALLVAVARHSTRMFGGSGRITEGQWKRRLVRWWWSEHLRQVSLSRRPEMPVVMSGLESLILESREVSDVPTFSASGLRDHLLGPRNRGIARSGQSLTLMLGCLLRSMEVPDFATDERLDSRDSDLDLHHIFPKAWARRQGVGDVDCLANLTLLTSATNNMIRDKAPAVFFQEFIEEHVRQGSSRMEVEDDLDRKLRKHGIRRELCVQESYRDFLEHRVDWLDTQLQEIGRA